VKRSRIEIFSLILDAASAPARKMQIMYKTTLSFSQLKSYLEYLEGRGLIRKVKDDDVWLVTEAGREYLKQYQIIANILQ
jgi:predicted transcriptional regulator